MSSRPFHSARLHIEDIEAHKAEDLTDGALAALSILLELSEEQVSKVIDHFCKGCGRANPFCPCGVCPGCRRDNPYCTCPCSGCGFEAENCCCKELSR